jgi:hypothetical protein
VYVYTELQFSLSLGIWIQETLGVIRKRKREREREIKRLREPHHHSSFIHSSFIMANNITMPRFGRASGLDAWTDADAFDVDLLAECLLEDGSTFHNGVTFDFR